MRSGRDSSGGKMVRHLCGREDFLGAAAEVVAEALQRVVARTDQHRISSKARIACGPVSGKMCPRQRSGALRAACSSGSVFRRMEFPFLFSVALQTAGPGWPSTAARQPVLYLRHITGSQTVQCVYIPKNRSRCPSSHWFHRLLVAAGGARVDRSR